ncbi:hypothetical protein FPV67DRAFT_1675786 [Lyophyllum atratum]|nr:hypothetical protein FPV67DRAFT_1675786 [Lyophyllum atratum]
MTYHDVTLSLDSRLLNSQTIVEGMGWDLGRDSDFLFTGGSNGWMDPGDLIDAERFSSVLALFDGTELREPGEAPTPPSIQDIINGTWIRPSLAPIIPDDIAPVEESFGRRLRVHIYLLPSHVPDTYLLMNMSLL